MEVSKFVWFDKVLVEGSEKISVPISSQGLNYGFGVFDGMRARSVGNETIIFRLADHIKRFYHSARKLSYPLEDMVQFEEMVDACKLVISENKLGDVYIRPFLYFGSGESPFEKTSTSNMHITVFAFTLPYPFSNSIKVGIAEKRKDDSSLIVDIKSSGQYQVFAFEREKARKKGFDDALYLDDDGNIAETVGNNIFLVKGNLLYTPSVANILAGFTRDTVIKIAPDLGYTIIEKKIPYSALYEFEEVFFSGTAVGIVPAKSVGDYKFFQTSTSSKFQEYYARVTRGEIPEYYHWLTKVKL